MALTPTLNTAMRDSLRRLFPTGRTLAVSLTKISQGAAAATMTGAARPSGEGVIVLLPQFSVRTFGDAESVNRIQWKAESGRSVRFVPDGQSKTFRWLIEDSTLPELKGTVKVTSDGVLSAITGEYPPMEAQWGDTEPPAPKLIHAHSAAEASRVVKRTEDQGWVELLRLTNDLQPFVRANVKNASNRVYREVNGLEDTDPERHIIDEIEQDQVTDRLMYGANHSDSLVIRLLRRVAITNATVRKSVMSFMSVAIRSGAETQVRNHIGDPHLGRVIRRIARQLRELNGTGSVDPNEVLAAYRVEFPDQRIGIGRVVDALTAGATTNALIAPFFIGEDLTGDAI